MEKSGSCELVFLKIAQLINTILYFFVKLTVTVVLFATYRKFKSIQNYKN